VRLFQLAASDWLAILHDDDWWLPGHLANISNIISTGPADLAAVATHVIYVSGEDNTLVHGWGTELPLHLAKNRPRALECVKLEYTEMLSLCRVYTPLHFSALCVRREVALYTSTALLRTSWYNADRLWFPSIAARGPIVFDPLPSVLVRWHQGNWAAGQTAATREAEFLEGCRQIDQNAISSGHDISAFWRIHLTGISKTERQMLAPIFARAYPEGNVEIGSGFPRLGIFERSKRFALHLGRRLFQHLPRE
jgi:hypothetical protein